MSAGLAARLGNFYVQRTISAEHRVGGGKFDATIRIFFHKYTGFFVAGDVADTLRRVSPEICGNNMRLAIYNTLGIRVVL